MLKPAILYKEEIEKAFAENLYTDDFFLYSGYPTCNELPKIEAVDDIYQYAVLDTNGNLIGWFAYRVELGTSTVYNFGMYSFKRGNPYFGKVIFEKMEELVRDFRRVEWRMIGGNPVQKSYDRFCEKHGGYRSHLHKTTKDLHGNYHDEYIYEIVKETE